MSEISTTVGLSCNEGTTLHNQVIHWRRQSFWGDYDISFKKVKKVLVSIVFRPAIHLVLRGASWDFTDHCPHVNWPAVPVGAQLPQLTRAVTSTESWSTTHTLENCSHPLWEKPFAPEDCSTMVQQIQHEKCTSALPIPRVRSQTNECAWGCNAFSTCTHQVSRVNYKYGVHEGYKGNESL